MGFCSRLILCLSSALLLQRTVVAADHYTIDPGLYAEGAYVFERNCVVCHGPRGDGNGEWAKGILPKPRSFREGMFKFRSTPFGKLPTDEDLARTIRGGLSGTAMGMFTALSDDEVRAVTTYVKSFSRLWRKLENHADPIQFPSPPAWLESQTSRSKHSVTGRLLFMNVCAGCHGEKADGSGPLSGNLKDIWNMPCKPSDLRNEHLRCGDAPADVFRLLTTGMNGTPMIAYDKALSEEQRWQIIAFILDVKIPSPPLLGGAPASKPAK